MRVCVVCLQGGERVKATHVSRVVQGETVKVVRVCGDCLSDRVTGEARLAFKPIVKRASWR